MILPWSKECVRRCAHSLLITATASSNHTHCQQHQEDDARLGVTWPRLPSHAKSRQVTQAPQLPRLCRTRPKKRVPGQIRYQGVPRHPNSTDLSDFSDLAKTPQFKVESVKFLVLDQDTPRRPSSHPKTQREGPNS